MVIIADNSLSLLFCRIRLIALSGVSIDGDVNWWWKMDVEMGCGMVK
jgi:hypothetical protein